MQYSQTETSIRPTLKELQQQKKSSKSFRNRTGVSIFEQYKTDEEIRQQIIRNVETLPQMSLYMNGHHPLEQLSADLDEFTEMYSGDNIDRNAALCDLFKILSGAQSTDVPKNIEDYKEFLLHELLCISDSYQIIVDKLK